MSCALAEMHLRQIPIMGFHCGHPSRQLSVSLCDGMYCLTLPSEVVPATCPVAMVILSGWTARLQGVRGRPKGQ